MSILTNKKFNLIINVLIVFICILMLIFFKARTFEKVLIIMILILKLLSVFDFFKNKRMEEKREVKKVGKRKREQNKAPFKFLFFKHQILKNHFSFHSLLCKELCLINQLFVFLILLQFLHLPFRRIQQLFLLQLFHIKIHYHTYL